MARIRITQSAESDDHASLYRDPSLPPPRRQTNTNCSPGTQPPSPSNTSDKENQDRSSRSKPSMLPHHLLTPRADSVSRAPKRRRLDECAGLMGSQAKRQDDSEENPAPEWYDPNQPIEERRGVRKGMRDLHKNLQDSKNEWLAPESTGLQETIARADVLFQSVKQTSDATLDSRILVDAGDVIHKKSTALVAGAGAQGVDVDEFVSKCISFMRQGDENQGLDVAASSSTQRRRRRATQQESDDEDEVDDGNGLNWEWLGAQACSPVNARPPVPAFLLGPLSVEKRIRPQRPRRERLQKGVVTEVRPEELKAADMNKNDSNNLKSQCNTIYAHLCKIMEVGHADVQKEYDQCEQDGLDLTDVQMREVAERHNLCENGGVSLLKFVVNPASFGQTVENLFYVSFLVKDGYIGIREDSIGMPSLRKSEEILYCPYLATVQHQCRT